MKGLSYGLILILVMGCSSFSKPKNNPDVLKYKLAGIWTKRDRFPTEKKSYLRINCHGDLLWEDNEGVSPFFAKRPWETFNGTIESINNGSWKLTNCVVNMSLEDFVPLKEIKGETRMSIHGVEWILGSAADCPAD